MSQETAAPATATAPEQNNSTENPNTKQEEEEEEEEKPQPDSSSGESKPDPNTEPQPEWQIKDYQLALSHLEELQDKLNSLRPTIPTLALPLRTAATTPSKSKLFTSIKDASTLVSENLRDFERGWRSEETRGTLERARASLEREGNLSAAEGVGGWGWREGDGEGAWVG